MLLFGLFRRLPLSSDFNNRKCLLEHLLCLRFDAGSSTLNRGLCGYAVLICHDIFNPTNFEFWYLLKRFIIWILSWSQLVSSFFGSCAIGLSFSGRKYSGLWHLAAGFAHRARVLRPLTWKNFDFGLKVSGLNFATPVHPTGRRQFSRLKPFASRTLGADAKWNCVRILCISQFWSCLFLSRRSFWLTMRVIPASAVFRNSCVCHLVFLSK